MTALNAEAEVYVPGTSVAVLTLPLQADGRVAVAGGALISGAKLGSLPIAFDVVP